MERSELKRALERGKRSSTYLVCGTDEGAKRDAVRVLEDFYCDVGLREWNVARVDGADVAGAAVLDLASTAPMLGDRRVVVVTNCEKLQEPDALLPFVQSPGEFSIMVLVGTGLDKRRKLFQAVRAHGEILEYEMPQGDALGRRVRLSLEASGVRLDASAAAIVAERVGDDPARLEMELEKLRVFAGKGDALSSEAVDALVARTGPSLGQYAIFDFVDAIAEGRGADAVGHLDALLAAGEVPLVVLTMIARQFRLLLGAYAWRGESLPEIAGALGLKSTFPVRKALAQVNRWEKAEIVAALEACSACDDSIKHGIDGRRALETLTVSLAWRRAQSGVS